MAYGDIKDSGALAYTLRFACQSRPFGVALLIAGVDENGPQLFHVDPSGTFMRYDAKSIGSGSEGAQTELQDSWHKVSPWFGTMLP